MTLYKKGGLLQVMSWATNRQGESSADLADYGKRVRVGGAVPGLAINYDGWI